MPRPAWQRSSVGCLPLAGGRRGGHSADLLHHAQSIVESPSREQIEHLEQGANALLEHYASMVPEALDDLTSEERHRVYKMMRHNVVMYADGLVEVAGAFGGLLDTWGVVSVKGESTSSSTATNPTSPRRGFGSPTT